jgi:hypothetical protein
MKVSRCCQFEGGSQAFEGGITWGKFRGDKLMKVKLENIQHRTFNAQHPKNWE